MLAATALWAALGGGATPASAAIRVVINDGSNTQVFYSSGDAIGFFSTTLGSFEVVLGSALTNFTTQSQSGASLSQSLLISDSGGAALPTLRVTTSVINAVLGVPDGQVTGGNQALVVAAGLARFTLPSSPDLVVGSDIDGNSNLASGTIQNNTNVNGTPVASLPIPIDGVGPDAQQTAIVGNNPAIGFTLVSEIVLTGASPGIMGSISSSSTVNALIPEPGPLALWGLGAVGLVVAAARRRFRASAAG
jgi:hypothetical protein